MDAQQLVIDALPLVGDGRVSDLHCRELNLLREHFEMLGVTSLEVQR
jgi:hypothetical protein